MKFIHLVAAMLITSSSPAMAESIFDSLNGLKRSVDELGSVLSAKPAPKTGADQAGVGAADEASNDNLLGVSDESFDTFDTNLGDRPFDPNDVLSFEVRGFKLGMSPREVRRIARREGFKASIAPLTSADWDYRVTKAANETLSRKLADSSKRIWTGQNGTDDSGNFVSLRSSITKAGSLVTSISYEFVSEGQTRAEIQQAVIEKYGSPCLEEVGYVYWGTCTSSGYVDKNFPNLTLYVGGGLVRNKLRIEYGLAFSQKLQAQFEADVKARRAATGRKAEF